MTEIIIGLWVLAGLFFLVLGFMPRMTDEERETMASEQRAKDQARAELTRGSSRWES
jgi:hypothetical protein